MSTSENIDIRFNVITDALDRASSKLQSMGSSISGLGMKLTAGVTAPIAGLALFGLKYNSTMQDLQTSFKVMLGSQEKAIAMTDKLNKMGSETPFESSQLAEYTKTMLAFGYTESNVLPIMSRLGDISLGNNEKMSSLTRTMGQINALGKLQGGDLNQLIGQGWNPLNEIMKKTGETTEKIRKRMSEGKVTYKEVEDALISTTSKGGTFFNGMAEGSKTLSGMISTLKDNFSMLIGDLTKPIFDKLTQILPKVISFIGMLQEKFKNLSPSMKTAILAIGGIVAAIGPILIVVGSLVGVLGGAIAGISAIAGALSAITPIVLGVASAIPVVIAQFIAISAVFAAVGTAIVYVLQKTGALSQIFDILKTTFNTVKTVIQDVAKNAFEKLKFAISSIKSVLDDISRVMKPFINDTLKQAKPIIQEIVKAFGELGNVIINNFGPGIKQVKEMWDKVFPYLVPVLKVVFENVKNIIITALNVIKTVINIATSLIKGDWSKAWEGIKNITSLLLDNMRTNISNVFNLIINSVSSKFNSIKSSISSAMNSAKNIVSSVMGTIRSLLSSFSFPKIKLPHFSIKGKFDLASLSVPSLGVNWYAKGGIFNSPNIIGVGEYGQEAVLPISKLDQIMANALSKSIDIQGRARNNLSNLRHGDNYNNNSASNNNSKNVNINYSGSTGTDDKNRLANMLRAAGVY